MIPDEASLFMSELHLANLTAGFYKDVSQNAGYHKDLEADQDWIWNWNLGKLV